MAKKKVLYKHYILESGKATLTAWLDAKVKKGNRVTLKDSENPKEWWTVVSEGDLAIPRDELHDEHSSKVIHEKDFHGTLPGLTYKNI
jgi:hypothetical protein